MTLGPGENRASQSLRAGLGSFRGLEMGDPFLVAGCVISASDKGDPAMSLFRRHSRSARYGRTPVPAKENKAALPLVLLQFAEFCLCAKPPARPSRHTSRSIMTPQAIRIPGS